MDIRKDRIRCPKFGGERLAQACICFDRYKSCRKTCPSLKEYIKENPNAPEEAVKEVDRKKTLVPMKFAGKCLPFRKGGVRCPICDFRAISVRGVKSHITKTHGDNAAKKYKQYFEKKKKV